eukprot:CFRG4057T1
MESLQSLEAVLAEFFACTNEERRRYLETGLLQFIRQPNSYEKCGEYLEQTNNPLVIYYCLLVYEEVVLRGWSALDASCRLKVRNFLLQYLKRKYSDISGYLRNKLVKVYVDLAKQEWPETYPHFLNDVLEQMPTVLVRFHILNTLVEEIYMDREDISIYRRRQLQTCLGVNIETFVGHTLTYLDGLSKGQNVESFASEKEKHDATMKAVRSVHACYQHSTPVVEHTNISQYGFSVMSNLIVFADRERPDESIEFIEQTLNTISQMVTSLTVLATKDERVAEMAVEAIYTAVGTLLSHAQTYNTDEDGDRVWTAVASVLHALVAESAYLTQVYHGRTGDKGKQIVLSILSFMLQLLTIQSTLEFFIQALEMWITYLTQMNRESDGFRRDVNRHTKQQYPEPAMRAQMYVAIANVLLSQLEWKNLCTRLKEDDRDYRNLDIEEHEGISAMLLAACDIFSRLFEICASEIVPLVVDYFLNHGTAAFTQMISSDNPSVIAVIEASMNCTISLMIIGTLHQCAMENFSDLKSTTEGILMTTLNVCDICVKNQVSRSNGVLATVHVTCFRTLSVYSEWIVLYGTHKADGSEEGEGGGDIQSLLVQITSLVVHTLAVNNLPVCVYSGTIGMLRKLTATIRPCELLEWSDMQALTANLDVIANYLPINVHSSSSAYQDRLVSALYVAVLHAYVQPYPNVLESNQRYTERSDKLKMTMATWMNQFQHMYQQVMSTTQATLQIEQRMRAYLIIAADIILSIRDMPAKSKASIHTVFKPVIDSTLSMCACNGNFLTENINAVIAIADSLSSQVGSSYITMALETVMSAVQQRNEILGHLVIDKLLQLLLRVVGRRTKNMTAQYSKLYTVLFYELLPRLRSLDHQSQSNFGVKKNCVSSSTQDTKYDILQTWFTVVYEMCDTRWDYFFSKKVKQFGDRSSINSLEPSPALENSETWFSIMEAFHWALGEDDITLYFEVATLLLRLDETKGVFGRAEFVQNCRSTFSERLMKVLVDKTHHSHSELSAQLLFRIAKPDMNYFCETWFPQFISQRCLYPHQTEMLLKEMVSSQDRALFAFSRSVLDSATMIRHFQFVNSAANKIGE